jgi:acyl carrier protein
MRISQLQDRVCGSNEICTTPIRASWNGPAAIPQCALGNSARRLNSKMSHQTGILFTILRKGEVMGARSMTTDDFRLLLEDVLDQSGLVIGPETSAKDVEGWDSLNNLRILLQIEQRYGIDLALDEIEVAKNVGDLLDIVNRALGAADAVTAAH